MKINNTPNSLVNLPAARTDGENSASASVSSSAAPSAAQITTLSSQLTALQALQTNLAVKPMFDAKKVDMIRQEIENGTFSVDTGKVADNMIKDAISFSLGK